MKVYTDNPLNSEGNARLLAKKTGVRDGETILFTLMYPKPLNLFMYFLKIKCTMAG